MEKTITVGELEPVEFVALGATLKAKMDTGATTCSIHATDIKSDESGMVTFICQELSPNTIRLQTSGAQTVHTSDNGGEDRPVVLFDIQLGGTLIRNVAFNLNDRSGMDTPVLIGKNVLELGFVVDVSKDGEQQPVGDDTDLAKQPAPGADTGSTFPADSAHTDGHAPMEARTADVHESVAAHTLAGLLEHMSIEVVIKGLIHAIKNKK